MVEVQIVIVNEFGEFFGRKNIINEEQYQQILEISKIFYTGSAFELTCEDDTFIVFPPDIVQKSILKIKRNN